VPVNFHTDGISFNLENKLRHKKWIKLWIDSQKAVCGTLDIIFVSNRNLRKINLEYLNHDYNTDVITFDYCQGKVVSGDIFISVDQVRINAGMYDTDEHEEMRRVMIHGINHLLGFDDRNEEERVIMRQKENEALHLWLKVV
jgi:rRNA maturation RNase YbeY